MRLDDKSELKVGQVSRLPSSARCEMAAGAGETPALLWSRRNFRFPLSAFRFIFSLLLLLATVPLVMGFSLLGPFKDWQTPRLGYNIRGDIGGPMFPGEESRWNVPVITYAFDQTFIEFFGTNGVTEVEKAIKILNDIPPVDQIQVVTNVFGFGPQRTTQVDFAYNGERVPNTPYGPLNTTAAALRLYDLKSYALHLLIEEMGLAEPARYTWTLRDRYVVPPGPLPILYTVIPMNFDPITLDPTSAVNGYHYGYIVVEPYRFPDTSDAFETDSRDPGEGPIVFRTVADGILEYGQYYQRLSRDDIGGLRYLYGTNRFNTELLIDTAGTTITGVGPNALLPGSGGNSPWIPYFGSSNLFQLNSNVVVINPNTTNNLVNQALRPGTGQFTFRRVNYDSIIGDNFDVVTSFYTDTIITNGRPVTQQLLRTIRQPDIIFTVADLGVVQAVPFLISRTDTSSWQNNAAVNGHGILGDGPGVIRPQVEITFSSLFPSFYNSAPFFLDDISAIPLGSWGTFDGTTNRPIVYPEYGQWTLEVLQEAVRNGR